MSMPGRSFDGGSDYRYGFNGKEKSDEVYGEGNIYDYGFRIYNPRLGKFLSVDPLSDEFPWYTPYQFAGNKPIWAIDIDGREDGFATMMMMDNWEKQHEAHNRGEITYEELKKQHVQSNIAVALGATIGAILATELFVTKGKITASVTTFITGSAWLGTLHHNRAANPKQEAERNQEFMNASTNLILGAAFSKVVGVLTKIAVKSSSGVITNVYKTFKSTSIRYSQSSVKGSDYEAVKKLISEGKDLGTIDIVKMKDNIYTSLDNKRLLAANELGKDIQAVAHNYDDVLDAATQKRIYEAHGVNAKTWGEAIEARTAGQAKYISRDSPNGSFIPPKPSKN